MDCRELLKDFILDFPTRLSKFEQSALETGLDIPISIAEIHIINKIGLEGSEKMSTVAKKLGITQATLTVACDKLEEKGLVARERDSVDKRIVTIGLTPTGIVTYSFHQALLDNIIDTVLSGASKAEEELIADRIMRIYDNMTF